MRPASPATPKPTLQRLTPRFAPPTGAPLFGAVLLSSDPTAEDELRRLVEAAGGRLWATRTRNDPFIDADTLRAIADGLPDAAAGWPAEAPFAGLCFACTSAAMLIGSEAIDRHMRAGRAAAGAAVTPQTSTPIEALAIGARALSRQRAALLTPYVEGVTRPMAAHLTAAGLPVCAMGSFETQNDADVGRLAPDRIVEAAISLARATPDDGGPTPDVIVVSCTGLRAVETLTQIENETGAPALASNQALAWLMLRRAGLGAAVPGAGRLFRLNLDGAPCSVGDAEL